MPLILLALVSLIGLVGAARFVIAEVAILSHTLRSSRFGLSFLLLGLLTSLTEISVAINAQADGHPEIYAGNLIGGAFVILLLIIPFLTIIKGGLSLSRYLPPSTLTLFCGLMGLPVLVALDGYIGTADALALLIAYGAFVLTTLAKSGATLSIRIVFSKKVALSLLKIAGASLIIFISCHYLVLGTEAMADALHLPTFIISIILLSLGTNIPELTLAVAAVMKKESDVALGDYVGSASFNALLLGGFSLVNGPYVLGVAQYQPMLYVFLTGLLIFFIVGYSKRRIDKSEALILLACYGLILLVQGFSHI